MELSRISIPTFIVAHKEDGCAVSPAVGAEKLKNAFTHSPSVDVKYFTGGKPPRSKPCEAKSAHGFYGIEDDVVAAIAAFIKSN
jgi:hypothetical protein